MALRQNALFFFFSAVLFAGAFLLFSVQPMTAKVLLPQLGGSPSVWNVCMLAYQTLLLAGYACAVFVQKSGRPLIFPQILLICAALAVLPVGTAAFFDFGRRAAVFRVVRPVAVITGTLCPFGRQKSLRLVCLFKCGKPVCPFGLSAVDRTVGFFKGAAIPLVGGVCRLCRLRLPLPVRVA